MFIYFRHGIQKRKDVFLLRSRSIILLPSFWDKGVGSLPLFFLCLSPSLSSSISQSTLTSEETYHFFRATLTKIHHIKINQNFTLISHSTPYESHLKNQKVNFAKKEKNAVKSQKVIFSQITESAHWEPVYCILINLFLICMFDIKHNFLCTKVMTMTQHFFSTIYLLTSSFTFKALDSPHSHHIN